MGRLVNGERRITDPRPENAGKLLIFCEGATEFNYLNYFKIYLENNLKAKYSDIVLEPIDTGGNAKHVYDYAEAFLDNVQNAAKYSLYEKHLVFDCDAPENIQDVITLMISSKNEYVLDYSNLMFETWLIMHFMQLEPDIPLNKREIHRFMREYLQITKYSSKVKAAPGTIGKILGTNGNQAIRAAVENAKLIESHWQDRNIKFTENVTSMNPSVYIHILIERLLDEIVYLCK